MEGKKYMTVVFECDLKSIDGNPFHKDTPFGRPFAVGFGNAFTEIDRLELEIEGMHEDAAGADI